MSAGETYDAMRAASYWSVARHEAGDELNSVLTQGEPRAVNEAYDAWETGLLVEAIEGALRPQGLLATSAADHHLHLLVRR
jgi:hypothetical protein